MVTVDSNIAIYAFGDAGTKSRIAADAIGRADFVSVQVLNEFASVAARKQGRSWPEIAGKVADIRAAVGCVLPIEESANAEALRIAERYRLSFCDALMLAVALHGGARTIYSEDMQHDLVIDGTLRILDPFR
jgi:predicted nucleic acid-binding protein